MIPLFFCCMGLVPGFEPKKTFVSKKANKKNHAEVDGLSRRDKNPNIWYSLLKRLCFSYLFPFAFIAKYDDEEEKNH